VESRTEKLILAIPAILGDKPPLVVNGSPNGVSNELIWELSQSCGKVVAVDSGLNWVLSAGVFPDIIVGDMDSVSRNMVDACMANGSEVVEVDAVDKDVTDLELALGHLKKSGFTSAVVTNFRGARIDHEMVSIGSMARSGMHVLAIDEEYALLFLCKVPPEDFPTVTLSDLGLEVGDEYSIVALCGPARVTQIGVMYPQNMGTIEPLSGLGVSNVVEEPDAYVRLWKGLLAVVLQL
jgi:thiamine pyrophosphokinase